MFRLWQFRRVTRVGGNDSLLQSYAESLVHDGAGVLHCLAGQPRLCHGIIQALDVGALYSLEFHRADGGRDVVFDGGPVALESQRLHLVFAECGEPFFHPRRHGDFIGSLIGALVNGSRDLGQLLPDFLLRGTVDAALDLLPGARVPACRVPGLPPAIWPLPDGAAALGVAG